MRKSELGVRELLQECLESNSAFAWIEFVRRFQPLISSVILKAFRHYGVSDLGLVDDLIQETYWRICRDDYRVIRAFEQRQDNSIFAFLKVVAASVAMDHFRARKAQKRSGEVADPSGALAETAAGRPGIDPNMFLNDVAACLQQVTDSERDRTVFWLYYQQGFTAKEISVLPSIGLSPKGVESTIYRLTQSLRTQLGARKRKPAQKRGEVQSPPVEELT
jgi:RNA polymerase sigma-70 factor, ECF subfamily